MPETRQPFFSVVIAAYNYGHLLPRAIESALNQDTDDSHEVIVVDDGSTDDTPEVVRPWLERIHYHRQANAGHCAANNKGIDLARGQWLCFLDADDELLASALRDFGDAIRHARQGTAILSGGYISVAEDGEEKVRPGHESLEAAPETVFAMHVRKQLRGFKHGCTVLHRDVFKTLRYPEGLRNSTDIVFLGRVLANHVAGAFSRPVVRIHAHPQRVRRNTALIVSAGLEPVDMLFDPAVMPAAVMPLKREFLQRRLLSLFGVCYRAGDYAGARRLWWSAVRRGLAGPWRPRYLKRMLVALVRRGGRAE